MTVLRTRDRLIFSAYFIALILSAAATLVAGFSVWIPLLLATLPSALLLRRAFDGWMALASGVILLLAIALGGLLLTAALSWPITPAFTVIALALGFSTAVAGRLNGGLSLRARSTRPTVLSLLGALSPLVGATLWGLTLVVARIRPHGAFVSWAMNGDSANNILFARAQWHASGIRVGPDENPVPLPAGLIVLGGASGRGSTPASATLHHDVIALFSVWAPLIALMCILFGVTACMWIARDRPVLRAVAGAGGSLLPLSWSILGYPIDSGYLGAHLAVAVVLCTWIAAGRARARPALVVGLCAIAAVVLLATWTPLALFPAGIMAGQLRRHRPVLAGGVGDCAFAATGVLLLLLFGFGVTLRSFAGQSAALSLPGGGYPLFLSICGALVVVVVVVGFAARRRWDSAPSRALVALVIAVPIGFGGLVFTARSQNNPYLTYYPVKFAWLSSTLLLVIVLGIVFGLIGYTVDQRRWRLAWGATLTVGALAFVQLPGQVAAPTPFASPIFRIVTGNYLGAGVGDSTARAIFEYVDTESPSLLWRSGIRNEPMIDFWAMQMQANSLSGAFQLRYLAYGNYRLDKVSDLCRILELMGGHVRVVTRDPQLADEVASKCPAVPAVVESLPPMPSGNVSSP